MNFLILGGTVILGRFLVIEALDAGHTVTLFNRGTTTPGLFPYVEHLTGDRDGGLVGLRGSPWDAVIETSGYTPRPVRDSDELVKESDESAMPGRTAVHRCL
ncbi:uncharacterized protein METZ01_LOCUS174423 [marine metagenome]|uniref:NAD-dependent epimerase/dehydratase domain-containing protein n=1 Tax=marine metagenome TaxID=408172 RepID=A0A382C6R8_9ZZZZ